MIVKWYTKLQTTTQTYSRPSVYSIEEIVVIRRHTKPIYTGLITCPTVVGTVVGNTGGILCHIYSQVNLNLDPMFTMNHEHYCSNMHSELVNKKCMV